MNFKSMFWKLRSVSVAIVILLIGASHAFGADAGYSEYFIPGDEEDMLLVFEEVGDGDQGTTTHAVITVTAWTDNTTIYYDHWEDGYDFDPDNPTTADETYTLTARGDSKTFTSANIPASPRGTSTYYDGRDYLYVAGGATTVTRASWTEAEGPNQSLAWEVYPVRPQLTTYILPFGEDLDQAQGYNDFERVFALVQATEDNTVLTVDLDADGTNDSLDWDRDGTCDGTSTTLDAGEVLLLDQAALCASLGYTRVETGTVIRGSETLQVQYVIGDEGTTFEIRGLSAFPRGFWDDEYYAPVDSAAGGTGDPTDIYLHNPHTTELTIDYQTTAGAGSFTISAGETASYSESTGGPVPAGSSVYLKGSDPFWGVSTIDVGATTHDWAYSLVPAFLLESEHFMGWAPSSEPITAGYYDDSGIFIAPAQDNIRVFVDTNNDGTADYTYDLDRLETQYVTDTDGDMSDTNIWATGPYALAYGQNPDTAADSNPALDVGYTTLPGVGFIELVLTVDKSADPVMVDTAIGSSSTFTLVVNSHAFNVDDVNVTDTLPTGWQYVDDSTTITLPDKSQITGNSADPSISGSDLTWSDTLLGDMDENQEITISFTAETTQAFSTGDLSRNYVEATGTRTVETVTQTFTTSDFVFVAFGDMEIEKTTGGVDPLYPGDTYTYTVTVTNPADASGSLTGLALYDPLPAGIEYVAASGLIRGPGYYLDQFNAQTYTNSNGTLDWSGYSWTEYGDGTSSPTGGDIQITGNILSLRKTNNRIERRADTSGFNDLVLSFDYRRVSLDNSGEYVDCDVCDDWTSAETCTGGWVRVTRIAGPGDDAAFTSVSYDLTALTPSVNPSANFAVRFTSAGSGVNGNERVEFDNVQIQGGFDDTTSASNDPPNFIGEGDGYTLAAGQSLQLTFQVAIDDPLATGVDEITNTASVTANEILLPVSDDATNIVVNPSSESATVGDRVWLDADGDGEQDVGEGGLANVEVTLVDEWGAPIDTAITDATGHYLFTDVEPGDDYYVELTAGLPAGLTQTAPSGRTDYRTDPFDLSAGDAYEGADLGFAPDSGTATFGDLVWSDADADGVRDAGEPGLEGITVTLYLDVDGDAIFERGAGDTLQATTTTAPGGSYLFSGISVTGTEDYFVFVDPAQAALSDYTPTTNDPVYYADVASGDVLLNADFGFENDSSTAFSIEDAVWLDSDGDGTQDPGENGISGVTVDLLDDSLNVIASATTDGNGEFAFTGVPGNDADYTIKITDTGGVLVDYYGTTAEAVAATMGIIDLDSNVDNTSNPNFGYNVTKTIGDLVFNDVANPIGQDAGEPGISGITVKLYLDDGDGTFEPGAGNDDGDAIATKTTDANGVYAFSGLADGDYFIHVDDTQAALSGYDTLTTGDHDSDDSNGHQILVTLSGGVSVLTADFGYRVTVTPREALGIIWEDDDEDGVIDAGEALFEGVTVGLYLDEGVIGTFEPDSDDTLVTTTTSDVNGAYTFTGLPSDSYWVYVTDDASILNGYDTMFEKSEGTTSPFNDYELVDLTSGDQTDLYFGYKKPVPTLVLLSSFRADEDDGQVVVEWQTAAEVGTIGFYLYRKDDAASGYVQVNQELLPGLLLSPQGGTYRYVDQTAVSGETYAYKLVEVETRGRKRTYGPFYVTVEAKEAVASEQGVYAGLRTRLKGLRSRIKSRHNFGQWSGREDGLRTRLEVSEVSRLFSLGAHDISEARKERLENRRLQRARNAILRSWRVGSSLKIAVSENGLYYLDAADISDLLGFPFRIVKRLISRNRLALTNRGEEVAYIRAEGDAGIYFYGEAIDSIYTHENIYWLERGRGRKIRAIKRKGPEPASGEEAFAHTVHVEEDLGPATGFYSEPDQDFWLWDCIVAGGGQKAFAFQADWVAEGDHEAKLTLYLKGFSDDPGVTKDHHVGASVNGIEIVPFNEPYWDGMASHEVVFYFDQAFLQEGENLIELHGLDTAADFSVFCLDSFDLTYQRLYWADKDQLLFRGGENRVVTVAGFTTPDILVLDVSHPKRPKRIESKTIDQDSGLYSVSIKPASPDALYLAATVDAADSASRAWADSPSSLAADDNRADYLVISPAELREGAESLADYRARDGLTTMVIGLEDVMDEFNHGIYNPNAIRDFLAHAYGNWDTPPAYVVLVGDGTFDYKDYLGLGDNLVPPLLVSTPYGLFASDNRLADVEGDDGVPEMAIGRLPVLTSDEVEAYVDKMAAYEGTGGAWRKKVLVLADNPDGGGNFPADSDDVADLLLQMGYSPESIYLSDLTLSEARQRTLDGIDAGAAIVNYIGHSALDRLADEGMLTTSDVSLLANGGKLPVLTAMTCGVGRFAMPGFETLSEALVAKNSGGAIAVWAPTGLSINAEAKILDTEFLKTALGKERMSLGASILTALEVYSTRGSERFMLDIYNLLGDPALHVK